MSTFPPIRTEDARAAAGLSSRRGCELIAELIGRGLIDVGTGGFLTLADPAAWQSYTEWEERARSMPIAPELPPDLATTPRPASLTT